MREFYTETKRKLPDQYDRYKNCSILKDITTGDTLLSTRYTDKIALSDKDSYHTVQANEEGRLDLLANIYYKNPLLWWVIAQANDIYDPISKPVSGDILRIPSMITLYETGGVLL